MLSCLENWANYVLSEDERIIRASLGGKQSYLKAKQVVCRKLLNKTVLFAFIYLIFVNHWISVMVTRYQLRQNLAFKLQIRIWNSIIVMISLLNMFTYFVSLQVREKETKPDQWNEYVQRTWGICQKKKRSDLRLDFWNMGNCCAHDLHMTSFCPYSSFSIFQTHHQYV